jgi:heptosyltransferase-2
MTQESALSPRDWTRPQPARSPAYRLRRAGDGWAADAILAGSRLRGSAAFEAPRLLVDLPNWLGDFVMALPATQRLVDANAHGSTTLHVRPATARLAAAIFPRARIVATPRRQMPLLTSRRLLRDAPRSDIGVTLRNASRAKIVLWLASRWRLGSSSQGGAALLSWSYPVGDDRHQVHDADPALHHVGLPGADPAWRIRLPRALRDAGLEVLHRAGVAQGRVRVGLAPGVACGGAAKRWPEERFGALAAFLERRGLAPVIVVGPGEGRLARSVSDAAGRDLPIVGEDLDAAGLAGVVSVLDALVGNDSGPVHTAAALDVPCVALFGPTDPRRTAPLGERSAVVVRGDLECAPCLRSRCPMGHRDCMRQLSVERVDSYLRRLIGERAPTVGRAVHA